MIVKLNGSEFFRITEPFGAVNSIHTTAHTGVVDLATFNLTPLPSVSDGVVEKVYHLGNYNIGNGIKIETPEGHDIIYGHLSEVLVKEGQHVHIGEIIGKAGSSGNSTGYHLHLGEKINGAFVDPSHYVDILQQLAHNILDIGWSTVQCILHFI
jgi:murein DD-endopeptidase MepM/ murein hydrolase activator NlpD